MSNITERNVKIGLRFVVLKIALCGQMLPTCTYRIVLFVSLSLTETRQDHCSACVRSRDEGIRRYFVMLWTEL